MLEREAAEAELVVVPGLEDLSVEDLMVMERGVMATAEGVIMAAK